MLLALACLPFPLELTDYRLIGFSGEWHWTYRAKFPLALGLVFLLFVGLLFIREVMFNKRDLITLSSFGIFSLLLLYCLSGISAHHLVQIFLPVIFFSAVYLFPQLRMVCFHLVAIVLTVFFLLHLSSIIINFEDAYLYKNHNFFHHEIYPYVSGVMIYSALVVYAETLPLWTIFFIILLKNFDSRQSFGDLLIMIFWIGLITSVVLGVLSGRKLFLLFCLMLLAYAWYERNLLLRLLRKKIIHVPLLVYLSLLTLNYQVFIPTVSRIKGQFLSGNYTSGRADKFGQLVEAFLKEEPVFSAAQNMVQTQSGLLTKLLFGLGTTGSFHNWWYGLLSGVGVIGLIIVMANLINIFCRIRIKDPQLFDRKNRIDLILLTSFLALESFVNVGFTQAYFLTAVTLIALLLKSLRVEPSGVSPSSS